MNLYSKLWKNLSRQPCVTLFSSCGTYYISYWNWKCCLLIIKMKLLLVYVCVYVYSWQATYVCQQQELTTHNFTTSIFPSYTVLCITTRMNIPQETPNITLFNCVPWMLFDVFVCVCVILQKCHILLKGANMQKYTDTQTQMFTLRWLV